MNWMFKVNLISWQSTGKLSVKQAMPSYGSLTNWQWCEVCLFRPCSYNIEVLLTNPGSRLLPSSLPGTETHQSINPAHELSQYGLLDGFFVLLK